MYESSLYCLNKEQNLNLNRETVFFLTQIEHWKWARLDLYNSQKLLTGEIRNSIIV